MATKALSQDAIQERTSRTQAERMDQYTLWQILGIWALAAIPMGLLSWVVIPAVSPDIQLGSVWSGGHPVWAAHSWIDLAVCPFHDHRPEGRGGSALGNNQAQAAPQRAAGSNHRQNSPQVMAVGNSVSYREHRI